MNERRVPARVIGPAASGRLRVHLGHRERDLPADDLPVELRRPGAEFVAVVGGGEFVRVEPAGSAWLDLQDRIRAVLNHGWDPIGVSDVVDDEYDSYIGEVHALLAHGAAPEQVADYLHRVETARMGLRGSEREKLLEVAQALLGLTLPDLR